MVNPDGQSVRRVGAEAQLNPASGLAVVRVDAAHLQTPFATRGIQLGAVKVDKKLVGVGNSRGDRASEANFSDHDGGAVQVRCLGKITAGLGLTVRGGCIRLVPLDAVHRAKRIAMPCGLKNLNPPADIEQLVYGLSS